MYYTKKNLPKHEPKTDCFAYGEKSKACQALREGGRLVFDGYEFN